MKARLFIAGLLVLCSAGSLMASEAREWIAESVSRQLSGDPGW